MAAVAMWTSKLGNKYPMATMQENDPAAQKELKRLRSLKNSSNSMCADCGVQDNSWASVSLGVFICMICSDVHRSVGTHVTKVKGCTGTYLWGPDELEKMRSIGNHGAEQIYGSEKINPDASKEAKQRFVMEKYDKRSFAGKASLAPVQAPSANVAVAHQDAPVVRRASPVKPIVASSMPVQHCVPAKITPSVVEMSDTFFDDFFNDADDNYFGNTSEPVKPQSSIVSKPVLPQSNSLDAFLNSTLHAEVPPATGKTSGYPAHLDPFADWDAF